MAENGTDDDIQVTSSVMSGGLPEVAACVSVVLLTSFVSNSLVILVFSLRPILLSLSNRFILNIIISNLLLSILVMPGIVVSMATGSWLLGDVMCQISGFVLNVLIGASNLTLVTVSVDRYFAIKSPLHYKLRVTPSRCTASLMAVWLLSVCTSVPPLLGWSEISYHEQMMLCTVNWSSQRFRNTYYGVVIFVLFFALPLTVMFGIYVFIFCAARGNSQRTRRNSVLPIPQEESSSRERRGSGSVSTLRRLSAGTIYLGQQIAQTQGWKAAVTSSFVLVSFLVCWLPYFTIVAMQSVKRDFEISRVTGGIAVLLMSLSCTTTSIVYVFRSRTFRTYLLQILHRETLVQELSGRTESRRQSDVSEIPSSLADGATSRQQLTQSSSVTLPGMSTS